jgi:hypothetical protein
MIESSNDLFCTTGDLITFQRALLAGELFSDARSVELLTERRNRLRTIPILQYGLGTMASAATYSERGIRRLPIQVLTDQIPVSSFWPIRLSGMGRCWWHVEFSQQVIYLTSCESSSAAAATAFADAGSTAGAVVFAPGCRVQLDRPGE